MGQELDLMRGKALRAFQKALIDVKDQMIGDGRKVMSDGERELLRRFGDPIRPFSLTMKSHLCPLGL